MLVEFPPQQPLMKSPPPIQITNSGLPEFEMLWARGPCLRMGVGKLAVLPARCEVQDPSGTFTKYAAWQQIERKRLRTSGR